MSGLVNWSVDAASNDTIDPPILWQEGQPANTVNNSMRAVMAALAKWHADTSGALIAMRGSGDAYALSTNQVLTAAAAAKAHTLSFTVDAPNQGPATLAPDNLPGKPVLRPLGRQLGPGDLAPGTIYTARMSPSLGGYVIVSPFIERPGVVRAQGDPFPDGGWIIADGRALSRIAYAALFERIGTAYGAGDNVTTFNVPNAAARALFGTGLSGAGGIGGTLGSTGGSETVTLTVGHMPSHTHGGTVTAGGAHDHGGLVVAAGSHNHGGSVVTAGGHSHTASSDSQGAHTHTGSTDVGGQHSHGQQYQVNVAGSGSTNRVLSDLAPNGAPNAGGVTDANGNHQHSFTTNSNGAHSHTITVISAGDHQHGITADGSHQHGITAAPDHTHGLSLNSAGSDTAHSNMPPGLVVQFVIKA